MQWTVDYLQQSIVEGRINPIRDVLGTDKKHQACHQHWKSAKANRTTLIKQRLQQINYCLNHRRVAFVLLLKCT